MKDFEIPLIAFPINDPKRQPTTGSDSLTTIGKPDLTIEEMECKLGCHERGKICKRTSD